MRFAKKKKDERDLVYASTAREILDLSATAFKKLNLQPVKKVVNPRYKCAPPAALYDKKEIEAMKDSDVVARLRSPERKAAANKACDTKQKKLLAAIEAINIEVPVMDLDKLIDRAINSYNDFKSGKCIDFLYADRTSDKAFLDRITVNYLRHELTSYDNHLADIYGKVGVRSAYAELNEKIYEAIADAYPDLEDECYRQSQTKLDNLDKCCYP